LTAADGVKLKVSFFRSEKPGPGVLLLHQCNRQRKVWDGLAQQLAAAGINVLTLDYRAFGESGDVPQDKATPQQAQQIQAKWPSDIDIALQYLESQPGVNRERIGVGGASCGVNNSVQAARRHSEIKSMVLLSGNTDMNGRNFLREDKTVPAFFAYAEDDEFKPSITAIQWLYSTTACSGKKLVQYPDGGHGSDIFAKHPDLPKQIVDWFVTTLVTTPGRAPVPEKAAAVPENIRTLDLIDQPGGTAKVEQMLSEKRKQDPHATLFDEAIVNLMGYEHMQAGDSKHAIEIFKLNAMAYPASPNVYDSLADAYLADGQKQLARENSKKALQMLSSDTTDDQQRKDGIKASAEQKLKQLGDDK
ncbi:MAG TPA: dienelactone hydrolase family protein, partial [Terriglobales bacterium]